jgi:hypothetical protein
MGGYGGVVWWGVKISKKDYEKLIEIQNDKEDYEIEPEYQVECDHDYEKHFLIRSKSKIDENKKDSMIPIEKYGENSIYKLEMICNKYKVKFSKEKVGWYLVRYELY